MKLAVVLSAVPAAPNSNAQLHRIRVYPKDVKGMVPTGAHAGLDDADGPPMEIRVGANVEVARVQWLDSRSSDIEQCFGIGE